MREISGHPHAGGDIAGDVSILLHHVGPSPRGWGHQNLRVWPQLSLRAIPTRVGTSRPSTHHQANLEGHPHAGGDIQQKRSKRYNSGGPSPRGWGHHCSACSRRPVCRAIPTRVGTSSHVIDWILGVAGHPHAGGDIFISFGKITQLYGPSPRGWGHHNDWLTRHIGRRAIPTRVGTSTRQPKL